MTLIDRRTFLESAAMLSAAGTIATRPGLAAAGTPKKSLYMEMLPKQMTTLEKFKLAVDVGFEGIEVPTAASPKQAEEFREASAKSGLKIHSVMNQAHWEYPLSSADPEVVKKSVAGMETSIRNAKMFGASVVLLVPAVVDAKTMYRDAYSRSQKIIRERLLPLAQEQKIIIGIEEVWNKFLLSPLEFAAYVDSFQSPWVQAYFDVGNILLYGYPQDWIRTLGKRIVKIHVKDFHMDQKEERFYWRNLGDGDVDWPEVRKALGEIGYDGYISAEIDGGDRAYLKDVVGRLERIIAGKAPVAKM
jgi:L-ribulose-5-phosphate 3-epimerase